MNVFPYLALSGRVILLGVERIAVKRFAAQASPSAVCVVYFSIGALLMIPFSLGEKFTSYSFVPGLLAASVIYSVAFVYYVRSLAAGKASQVSPLYNFNILFLALGAWLFLGEKLGAGKIA